MRLSLWLVLLLAVSLNSQQHNSKTDQPKTSAPADRRGSKDDPLVVNVVPTAKSPEEIVQERQDRNQKTSNDGNLVKLTAVLALAAIFQLIVYGYQSMKLKQTVESSGKQSEAMERHIEQAARSATAMEAVADKIEDGNKMIMRAYVTTIIGTAVFQERRGAGQSDLKFEGKVQVLNTGNTPARKVRIRKKADILVIPTLKDFDFSLPQEDEDEASSYASIGAHQSYVIESIVPDFVPDAEVTVIKEGKERALCIWGDITYEDIFGNTHLTKFAHWLYWWPNGKLFGYYIPGQNEAD